MNYVLDLFTPETWRAFRDHGAVVSGFSPGQRSRALNLVRPGDIFVCYLVRLSRWCGLLQVESEMYEDSTPLFRPESDPYTIRYRVKPLVILDEKQALPIRTPRIWNGFSRTRELEPNSSSWPVKAVLQASLVKLRHEDGIFLSDQLKRQATEQELYPFSDQDERYLRRSSETVKATGGVVTVVVPESANTLDTDQPLEIHEDSRESIRRQALLVKIGLQMNFDIWIPKNDRSRVERELGSEERASLIDTLPLNYDRVTFKTIENIDVLWLKKKRLVRAFEVEHTTAVYSGLLRMADLLALQPNIDIRLHIVAPDSRREKVLDEIQRPVFALLDKGPLAESCSFISYESLDELAKQEHLAHMNDTVLEAYEEVAADLERR